MADQQFLDYDGLAAFKDFLNGVDIATATGDGAAYTATIPNVTALKKGLVITIIPDTTSSATIPTLNVNGLGAKNIKQRLSLNTSLTTGAATASWMVANKPVPLLFDGTNWVTITGRPAATTLYGVTPISNGGTGASTADEARINLGIGGSTLYVNAPAGVTVTATKDETTYTRTADTEGLAIFESLAVGTWTVQITDGVDTSTRTVVVKPDYSVTMAFFEATINITYPAGSTCTCTDGATTLTAPDTSGTWACIVPNAGTWTVSCTDNVQSDSGSVNITAEGQSVTIRLNYAVTAYRTGTAMLSDVPKEDTIGIVTETDITGVVRSTSDPSNPVSGMVWILTSDDGYPISASQYISGEWIEVTSMSYQNGKWGALIRYLYNQGNEYTEITDGWSAKGLPLNSNFNSQIPTFTKNSDSMIVKLASGSGAYSGMIHINKDIDLTNVNEITALCSTVTVSGNYSSGHISTVRLMVIDRNSTSASSAVSTDKFEISEGTKNDVILSVNTETISGLYDVVIMLTNFANNATITAEVQSVKML